MATSVINNMHDVITEVINVPLEWYSTANAFSEKTVNVAKAGYIPVSVGFAAKGTLSSYVFPYRARLDGNSVEIFARMVGQTPASTTQNSIDINVTYIKA